LCLHEKITILCREKGVSIYRMCKETGIRQNTVSNWQNRENAKPELDIAVKMADYFGVNPSYFLKE